MAQQSPQARQAWHGSIVHTEVASNDPAATRGFLHDVFGMEFVPSGGPMEYHVTTGEGRPSCGVRGVMQQEPGPGQTPYVSVPDLDEAVGRATRGGGSVLVPRTAVPGWGWFAWFLAPGGPVVAAWEEDPSAA